MEQINFFLLNKEKHITLREAIVAIWDIFGKNFDKNIYFHITGISDLCIAKYNKLLQESGYEVIDGTVETKKYRLIIWPKAEGLVSLDEVNKAVEQLGGLEVAEEIEIWDKEGSISLLRIYNTNQS
ncbi:MAG: hypothetical protein V1865_01550 [bacterium]